MQAERQEQLLETFAEGDPRRPILQKMVELEQLLLCRAGNPLKPLVQCSEEELRAALRDLMPRLDVPGGVAPVSADVVRNAAHAAVYVSAIQSELSRRYMGVVQTLALMERQMASQTSENGS